MKMNRGLWVVRAEKSKIEFHIAVLRSECKGIVVPVPSFRVSSGGGISFSESFGLGFIVGLFKTKYRLTKDRNIHMRCV